MNVNYGYPQQPPYPPYQPAPPGRQDDEQLNLLSVLFYVYAALVGVPALLFGAFAIIPALILSSAAVAKPGPGGGAPPAILGGIFLFVFGALAAVFIVKSVLMIFAGRALSRRSGYTLAMVGACLALLNIPLGTALGVFTLVVLQKPEVKARFGYR